jgi:hypothetical protein
MATTPEDLEQYLRRDLRKLDQRLVDAEFCGDLYRTLANHIWRRSGVDDVHVSLSWGRTEQLVNDLRGEVGRPPMTLAQTGGEGFETDDVVRELEGLGWYGTPLDASRHDDQHVSNPEGAPYTPPSDERFAKAHEEAEEERRRRVL